MTKQKPKLKLFFDSFLANLSPKSNYSMLLIPRIMTLYNLINVILTVIPDKLELALECFVPYIISFV